MILLFKEVNQKAWLYQQLLTQSTELRTLCYWIAFFTLLALIGLFFYKRNKHRFWKTTTILTSLCIFTTSIFTILQFKDHYLVKFKYNHQVALDTKKIQYNLTLEVLPTQKSWVLLPIPSHPDFGKSLKITQGIGSFQVIDTQYGPALEVYFSGKVLIEEKFEYQDNSNYYPELSLVDQMKVKKDFRNSDSLKTSKKMVMFSNRLPFYKTYHGNIPSSNGKSKINLNYNYERYSGTIQLKLKGDLQPGWQTKKFEPSGSTICRATRLLY